MKVAHAIVVTPADDPVNFDPAWRFKAAVARADSPGWMCPDPELDRDRYVNDLTEYLIYRKKHNSEDDWEADIPPELKHFRRVLRWYNDNQDNMVRWYVESSLLAVQDDSGDPVKYETISIDTGVSIPDIDTYERLFFNTRNADKSLRSFVTRKLFALGTLANAPRATQPLSMGQMVRKGAVTGGYAFIAALSYNPTPAVPVDLMRLVERKMEMIHGMQLEALITGNIEQIDLGQMQNNYANTKRMLHETGEGVGEHELYQDALAIVGKFIAPHMREVNTSEGEKSLKDDALESRFKAAKRIEATDVTDRGPEAGVIGMRDDIQEHLKRGEITR